jgi:uncharacterized membrane protein
VNLSILLIGAGTLLSFLRGGYAGGADRARMLAGAGGAFPRTPGWLLGGLARADGQAVIVLGLVVLISTPVVRIVVSLAGFAKDGDRRYVAITAVVLLLLLASLLLGKAG